MVTFSKHKWWILTVLLTAPLVAFAAGVPNVFAPNTVISSAAVNANFTNLSDRVTALETALQAKSTITMLIDNAAGPLPIPATSSTTPATFTSAGGPTLVIVSGSGWTQSTGGAMDITVQVDGAAIGHLLETTNEPSSHKAFPARAFKITPTAGNHNVQLLASAATTTDGSDHFSVTVVELAH